MSENQHETENEPGVPDEALPEDLVPGDDNPLAEGLDDGETVDDLLDGGKQADQSSEEASSQDASSDESHDG